MKELFDHLKLAHAPFRCHFAREFTSATRKAGQMEKGTVTASYQWNKVNILIFSGVFILWVLTLWECHWHC